MNLRSQSLVLVTLLAAAGCSSVLPSMQAPANASNTLASAASSSSTKRSIFTAWDTDGDGLLSLAEYEAGFLSIIQPAPTPDQLPQIKAAIDAEFNHLDTNGDGFLTYAEFRVPKLSQLGQVTPVDVLDGSAFLASTADSSATAA